MYVNYSGKLAAALLISLALATGCTSSSSSGPLDGGTASSTLNNNQEAAADPIVDSIPESTAVADPCAGVNSDAEAAVAVEASAAETSTIRYFEDDRGLAIRGADPVAYFTQGGPVAGSAEFAYTWNNATWQFASAENRDLFAANPEQYAPQYGGFCAWAVSQGYTASTDPNAWRIVDGKLYLNYNQGVQRRWERDIPGNINKANANWPGVLLGS